MVDYRSVFRPGLFQGKVVIVTGGGSGIGRCIAHELVSLGAQVALVGRTAAKLEAVQAELGGEAAARIYAGDIRDGARVHEIVAAVLADFGHLEGLVNCAGGQFPAALRDISENGWNAVVRNNLTGTFLFSREAYVAWFETHGGAIVNIGADFQGGMPGMGHSGAARGGQANFTFAAAVEWGHAGVRVNLVQPGFIASSGLDRYPESAVGTLRNVAKHVPLKRHGTESEIAAMAVFLLSDAAAYINGAMFRVDGGLHHNTNTSFYTLPEGPGNEAYNGFPLYKRPAVLGP